MNRRRFLAITAGALAAGNLADAAPVRQWTHSALGARVTLTLAHPDGDGIARRAFAEIDRLEDIFSLYRGTSALARLNAMGSLAAPPFELLECLGLCGTAHRATAGLFDPTVQPLWALYASSHAAGHAPDSAQIAGVLRATGWSGVTASADQITLRPGMALTLNGVAQGYVADRVAARLRAEGLSDVLVDTGELHAIGGDWPVALDAGGATPAGEVSLRDTALASSAPLGTVFDAEGRVGHILDPRTGIPAAPRWRLISVTAPRAALADALSTAMVLMDEVQITRTLEVFPDARLVAAVSGSSLSRSSD